MHGAKGSAIGEVSRLGGKERRRSGMWRRDRECGSLDVLARVVSVIDVVAFIVLNHFH
jgi:hypothetical protein